MSYDDYPSYVPIAERLSRGRAHLTKLAKAQGRTLAPVTLAQKQIATSFWGRAWCEQLERHRDFASRLPRGRTYVRNGSVLDLRISEGKIEAFVAGSELYTVTITLKRLEAARWQQLIAACAGRIGSLIGLLRGELSHDVLAVLTDAKAGLFPAPREITLRCTCPDYAFMCKHVAAALYGVGARLDQSPELFFVLRQVDQGELLAGAALADVLGAAGVRTDGSPGKRRIATSAVASLFGIELEEAPPAAEDASRNATSTKNKKSATTKKLTAKKPRSGSPPPKPRGKRPPPPPGEGPAP